MSEKNIVQSILDGYSNISSDYSIKFVEVISSVDGKFVTRALKKYSKDFSNIEHNELVAEVPLTEKKDSKEIKASLKKEEANIFVFIKPCFTGVDVTEFIVFQSDKEFDEKNISLINFIHSSILAILEQEKACDPSTNKYRIQLTKLREMQAKLFPSFSDIDNYDVKAAYLPADLMSGNFIDAFYMTDNIYQIVMCDVGAYDAVASFAGATIRTLLRATIGKNLVPSAQIEVLNQRLTKIAKDSLININVVIYQINTKTSEVRMTSLGSLNTMYFIKQKKSVNNLNKTTIGQHLTKKTALKDIAITLSEDDSLLFFSKGVTNATTPDGKSQFGEDQLLSEYRNYIEDSSSETTSGIIDTLYTYTDYAPLEEDVMLLSIKKHTS